MKENTTADITATKNTTKFYAIVLSAYFIFTIAMILIFGLTSDHNLWITMFELQLKHF